MSSSKVVLVDCSYLHTMYRQSGTRVQFLMTYVTLKMLCFLVLNENLLIIKFPVAVPKTNVKETVQHLKCVVCEYAAFRSVLADSGQVRPKGRHLRY